MSRTIKSGRSCCAFSIAPRPFSASPHRSTSEVRRIPLISGRPILCEFASPKFRSPKY
jgi:hypothetical protein